ncbi:adenylate cyclase type 10-like [Schistocerca gregaria]|uniref:adenylate cyclase type 10-like n=1 Tax=Schistocerca gregaria TaxID=7010 RepID=UPI00211E799D|nr:adenylate cyclase type 10-like [Schistocerca gregaria]
MKDRHDVRNISKDSNGGLENVAILVIYNSSMLVSKSLYTLRKESLPAGTTSLSFHTRSHMLGREIDVLASFVPDEVIYHNKTGYVDQFETVLMLGDISGFTNLCEKYSKMGPSGPSCLTDVLNSYIGSMVQETLTYGGDVFKFSGDAFLSIWKPNERQDIREITKKVARCAFSIQKTHGQFVTSVSITLKVKLAITAGESLFAIIGNDNMKHYMIAGEPIWNIRRAERNWLSGDILVDSKAWSYMRAADYLYKTVNNGQFVKILGVRTEDTEVHPHKFMSSCMFCLTMVTSNKTFSGCSAST